MKSFDKYQAMGNDMIVIDPGRSGLRLEMTLEAIQLICDRHFGVGADGICYGPLPGHSHPLAMRFFNPDGSEAEKSGNGLRIFARYVWERGLVTSPEFTLAIGDEVIPVQVLDVAVHTAPREMASGRGMATPQGMAIKLGMGRLQFEQVEEQMVISGKEIEITTVSIGNPHAVIFTDDLTQIHELGPTVENAPQFPERTNVQLVKILDHHTIQIEIWERGAGYTLASGTSSSAASGAAVKTGRCQSPVEVRMAGGKTEVTIDPDWRVEQVGEVTAVYRGTFSLDMQQLLRERMTHSALPSH